MSRFAPRIGMFASSVVLCPHVAAAKLSIR